LDEKRAFESPIRARGVDLHEGEPVESKGGKDKTWMKIIIRLI
jgi:hypothetical protein